MACAQTKNWFHCNCWFQIYTVSPISAPVQEQLDTFINKVPFLSSWIPCHIYCIGGFHVTSSPPCWWTKTKDLSLASFVRPPEVVHFPVVLGVSRGWLKTSYCDSFIKERRWTNKGDRVFSSSLNKRAEICLHSDSLDSVLHHHLIQTAMVRHFGVHVFFNRTYPTKMKVTMIIRK